MFLLSLRRLLTSSGAPSLDEKQQFSCLACQTVTCYVCGEQPRHAFSAWALNQSSTSRHRRCIDCSHPPCSKAGCSTCKKCRSELCRQGDLCSSSIEALHSKLQPKNLDEKQAGEHSTKKGQSNCCQAGCGRGRVLNFVCL